MTRRKPKSRPTYATSSPWGRRADPAPLMVTASEMWSRTVGQTKLVKKSDVVSAAR